MSGVRLVRTRPDGGEPVEHQLGLPAVLGRREDCTLVLDDPTVSRRHARIDRSGGRLTLTDLGSGNGSHVNDTRVTTPAALRPGDRVRLGEVEFVVDPPPSLPPPAATLVVDTGQLRAARAVVAPRVPPARRVLEAAEAHNAAVGHELDGFLSRAHGFLPLQPPETTFPPSHAAWDEVVGRLPELFRTLGLRAALDRMPVLDASAAALPDRWLLRASTLLGTVSHAYQYLTVDPPASLPPSLLEPWRTVSARLGKAVPAVSYTDLFFYNWRLRDPSGPRRLANLDLLVPTWANPAERVFYLVTTEFAMELAPLVGAMVDAQQAVLDDDREALRAALLVVLERLRHVTEVVYPQIDPNPLGATHLDQVLWAKTVGTAGVPIMDGAPSPSGTAQPHVHALDAFLGRTSFHTVVGQQGVYLAGHFPRHWQEFVTALRAVSVRDHVERTGDRVLRGLHDAVVDAYVGDRGWMGAHRIKAYGFLEVSFKVGRQVTTGARFTGLFKDRTWDRVDDELAAVREERRPPIGPAVVVGRPLAARVVTTSGDAGWVAQLDLDVAGQGVQYRPGDRVGVLPENDADLVRRTLHALQATGDEIVTLDPRWQRAVALRAGHSADTGALPLRTLLTFGRIRPVSRAVAGRLLGLSAAGALARVVGARMEDQWELWDLLGLVSDAGYDVTRLWRSAPDDPESICAVVPPEDFRLYSIASAMDDAETAAGGARTLRVVVAGLTHHSPRTPYSYPRERRGSGSWFLHRVGTDPRYRNRRVSLRIVPAPRFRLPPDPARPVVMFAGGSGVAPFLGFVQARAALPSCGPALLFLGVRAREDVVGSDVVDPAVAAGRLELHVAASREDGVRVPDLVAAHAERLWDLLVGDGPPGQVYVCGRATFAAAVVAALGQLAADRLGSVDAGTAFLRRLTAEGRLLQDVFTTYRGDAEASRSYDVSDLVTRTVPERGCWTAIAGRVYDLTEFVHLHVGGPHVVRHNLGLDATEAWRRVLHDANPEIEALLAVYEIGTLRRLRFGSAWGVVLTADGLRAVSLQDFFAAWVRYLYLVVGMAGALRSDHGFAAGPTTGGEAPGGDPTRFTAQFVVEAHRRFLVSYLDGLLADDLRELWAAAVGFCAPEEDARSLGEEVDALADHPEHAVVRRSIGQVKQRLLDGGGGLAGWGGDHRTPAEVLALCRAWAEEDLQVLEDVVAVLRRGVLAFERHEGDVVARGGPELLAALRGVPTVVADYYRRVAARTTAAGFVLDDTAPDVADEPVPADGGVPGHGGPLG